MKLVNGHPTQALLSIVNEEPEPINVAFVGGSLWAQRPLSESEADGEYIVRNFTTTKYNIQIPAGEKESVSYRFATELHPQDLKLKLFAVVTSDKGAVYTAQAFDETVSIVEPDTSFFDPQL